MIKNINFQAAHFLLSVATLEQLPPDEGNEVAIIGRSNAGKSSVLNQLTQNKTLARVSKTPGRTQLINLFGLGDQKRIADLPGYGYAKVPDAIKKKWQRLLDDYLQTRECLSGLLLIMDIRHPLKEFDQQMLAWAEEAALPVHILLNKADKLTQNHATNTLRAVKEALKATEAVSVQTFSAMKGTGIKELKELLNIWFSSEREIKIHS